MEKYTMVKTEVQPNGDIFLFYVDENGTPLESTDGVIGTVDQEQLQQLQGNYVLEELPTEQEYLESVEVEETSQAAEETYSKTGGQWLDEETEKLLIFYIDNKEAFKNPSMKKKHLWEVACKTMLVGKNPTSCEMKFRNMKRNYLLLHVDRLKNNREPKNWPFYELCHQAFHDDSYVQTMVKENLGQQNEQKTLINIPTAKQPEGDGTVVMKKLTKSPDEKVRQMLELYLKCKKEGGLLGQKKVWDKVAAQNGEDAEYWHKKFLNFKLHYVRMLEKRKDCGWPYMSLFDEIFKDDEEFQRRYGPPKEPPPKQISVAPVPPKTTPLDWNETEKTVLVKYYFDCLDDFHDQSLPNSFLWNEVGRLLDKKPGECSKKYDQLKSEHLALYTAGGYDLKYRKPIAILFDNIISQETEAEFCEPSDQNAADLKWETERIDEMVQFLFDNIEIFKDPLCHFVCWAAIAAKLEETLQACRAQWKDLTALYKSILNDKRDDPELQIDWRYIDIFDRIFDYGMDTKLLEGYEIKNRIQIKSKKKVQSGAKASTSVEDAIPDNLSDLELEELDEKPGKRARGVRDPKQLKILEYYLKYKDKFNTHRRKQSLWEALAVNLGISAEQCAHRFRNLKQVYMAYIQREIEKPDKPILWPYFALCKKAFGYRQIKNKMKQSKNDMVEQEEWTPREIKALINHFRRNFNEIDSNPDDKTKWASVAKEISKSETACRDKFKDLKNSYKKIVTMMTRNPDSKINWKYFKLFEEIYAKTPSEGMEVDSADGGAVSYSLPANAIKTELQDDDLQCIIVIPEGEDTNNLSNAQIILNSQTKPKSQDTKVTWPRDARIELLNHVLEYVEANKGTVIDIVLMFSEIGSKLNRTPGSCRHMYYLLKSKYKNLYENSPKSVMSSKLFKVMHNILALKPNFSRAPLINEENLIKEQAVYTDVPLPLWKVEKILKYYLEHVEEFVNPKYDTKQAWSTLSKAVEIPIRKVFMKVNYLKQFFNPETNEVNGEKFEFADVVKEILEKEFICKIAIGDIPEPTTDEAMETSETTTWTDDESEQLLSWYLANLDKFKNPIYAPSHLWIEASNALNKSAVACSEKMTEIRSQYSAMAKENPDALSTWRFYDLCQKIYGTGKIKAELEQQ